MENNTENEKGKIRWQQLRQPSLKLSFAVLITWAFYIDLWNGAVPDLPGPLITATSIGIGAIIGVFTVHAEVGVRGKRLGSWYGIAFLIAVTIAILVPPIDIPVGVEIGLLASFWGSAVGHFVLLTRR